MTKCHRILISAGPTIEPIDPIRFLSNHSSGKMGYALAHACVKMGFAVTLVSGPTALSMPAGVKHVPVVTARDMQRALQRSFPKHDLLFMVAAVADYRVQRPARHKIKKGAKALTLKLVPNPDILTSLAKRKRGDQIVVGFAAETKEGIRHAHKKLVQKNLDWIVLNEISSKNKVFGSDDNQVTLLARTGQVIGPLAGSKIKLARAIVKKVVLARRSFSEGGSCACPS